MAMQVAITMICIRRAFFIIVCIFGWTAIVNENNIGIIRCGREIIGSAGARGKKHAKTKNY
jgi:hypothetical protein